MFSPQREAAPELRLDAERLDPACLAHARAGGRCDPCRLRRNARLSDPAHLLARQFASEGLQVGAEHILLTSSGTQAIDLVCRLLLQPSDTVLLDDPCYFNFQALLRAHRVKIVSVPMTPTGPDIALFAQALAKHRPRLYVTNSAIHNPTGATLSPHAAHRVLMLAAAQGVTIVEDG